LNISPQEAKIELAKRELARRHLGWFIKYHTDGYRENWHHKLIIEKLEAIERGEIKKLMIFVPPQNGKSTIASENFPAWFFGRNPKKAIIAASYNSDLAVSFGRKARNIVASQEYKNLFPNIFLAEDSKAAGQWNTNQGGEYTAVGIGGGTTGRRADVFLIDDPVKDKQEAESQTIQERNIGWYKSVAKTRLSPTGAIVVIQCLTGETPVLMADGKEKPLREICVGDMVATFDDGKLSTSKVLKHKSNGVDNILAITTSSGRIVRGNKRHPFLIELNGKFIWKRLENLNTTHHVVVKDNGVNGEGRSVFQKGAINQQSAEDIVRRTTTKRNGQMEADRHQSMQSRTVMHILNTVMASRLKSMTHYLWHKMENVLFANSHQERMFEHIGAGNCALTTVISPTKSEDSSAMTVISLSDTQKVSKQREPLLNISDFTTERIVSIKSDGAEEVFDVQIAQTENFIANGLVSHNTRWHDEDLSGQILSSEKDWEVISLPAIAECDDEHRKTGEALWSEQYSLEWLLAQKKDLGLELWSALYQQNPLSEESLVFRRQMFRYRTRLEVENLATRCFVTIDPAPAKSERSDYVGVCINKVDSENFWNLKAFRIKFDPAQLISLMFRLYSEEHFECIGVEKGMYYDVLKPFLDEEMRKRNVYFTIKELDHGQRSKELRIRGLLPRYEARQIIHIEGECNNLEDELLRFPKAVNDDVSDAVAYQLQIAEAPFGYRSVMDLENSRRELRVSQMNDTGM
jgi:hypothetical protein